jgi:AcrR family transcriptional regulator
MGRPAEPARKTDLLEKAVDFVLDKGLQDLSLRPLADVLGTNARMLLYHFGSKEQLIAEVLMAAQQRQQKLLQLRPNGATDLAETLQAFWQWYTSAQMVPFARLLYEVEVRAMQGQGEYRQFAKGAIRAWVNFLMQSVPGCDEAKATFVVGVFSGLLLDRLTTGEHGRVDGAFALFVNMLEQGGTR